MGVKNFKNKGFKPENNQVEPPRPKKIANAGGNLWLYGHHAVTSALKNPHRKVIRLLVVEGENAPETKLNVALEKTNKRDLEKLLPAGAVHQGIAALVAPLEPFTLDDIIIMAENQDKCLVVALDQVTDPHNVGAILRSAAAFDALAVIMPEANSPPESGVLAKSASGALDSVPVVKLSNLAQALKKLKDAGFWTIGLDGNATSNLSELDSSGKNVIILGSEGDGLRRLTREACDYLARLPISYKVESLNVSNAAAIALYELATKSK